MPVYKAPLRDMKFLLNEVFDYPGHYASLPSGENATPDIVDAILAECAKFSEQVLSPLYQSGDEEGCTLIDGEVKTPSGYKAAYDQYVMGGWQGLSAPEEFGGQGLPASMGLLTQEMMGTANWSFSMYPGLSMGGHEHHLPPWHRRTATGLPSPDDGRPLGRHHVPDRTPVRHRSGPGKDESRTPGRRQL